MFGMISERIDQLMMEKNTSTSDPSAEGCSDYDTIMMKESPSLPPAPKFDYPSSSSTDFFSCSSDMKNEFGMISDEVMEKDKSNDPSTKGCNEDDVIMMKEFPSLSKFDNQSSPSKDFYNYSSALKNQFDYDVNQWLNLPGLTNTTADGGIVFEPFPDLIDFEFQGLNNFAGSFTDMINCY
ncbi:hypothetical protein C5167_050430 [Papaver somniferum]|uniref:Uncharacterized protein n=1 Tax=Papaver somniferum TaxID=3469 RepID=A0A4Y7KQ11_PAPSO|nr:hypothetical protein C5167_050430 [Papaver somniferum]